jgi:hypothetical protein
MDDLNSNELEHAVETRHGGRATFVQTLPVREVFWGRENWEGVVYVFDLEGNLLADRAYAWSSFLEGRTQRRVSAVLRTGSVTDPRSAVRATIVAEEQEKLAVAEAARSTWRWAWLAACRKGLDGLTTTPSKIPNRF